MDPKADSGLERAEVGKLLCRAVAGVRRCGGERADDGSTIEDIDLVAFGGFAERDVDLIPIVAADAGLTNPAQLDVAACRAGRLDVYRRARDEASAMKGLARRDVGRRSDVLARGSSLPIELEASVF